MLSFIALPLFFEDGSFLEPGHPVFWTSWNPVSSIHLPVSICCRPGITGMCRMPGFLVVAEILTWCFMIVHQHF